VSDQFRLPLLPSPVVREHGTPRGISLKRGRQPHINLSMSPAPVRPTLSSNQFFVVQLVEDNGLLQPRHAPKSWTVYLPMILRTPSTQGHPHITCSHLPALPHLPPQRSNAAALLDPVALQRVAKKHYKVGRNAMIHSMKSGLGGRHLDGLQRWLSSTWVSPGEGLDRCAW